MKRKHIVRNKNPEKKNVDRPSSNGHKSLAPSDNPAALQIVDLDGRVIGIISDPGVCAGLRERADLMDKGDLAAERFFPCRSNAEVRAAFADTLHSQIEIEVAGGIVRHHCGW